MDQGLLFVNSRGLVKSSMVFGEGTPARWESRYGSVTFNQYWRELPASGMNEAGLVAEVMWLGVRHSRGRVFLLAPVDQWSRSVR